MKRYNLGFLAFVIIALVVGCGQGTPTADLDTDMEPPVAAPVMDYDTLIGNLTDAGTIVKTGEEVAQPVLSVTGQSVDVNGEPVQVYEYESVNAAQAEAELVSDDGMQYGTTALEWDVTPHFFHTGKLIVLYLGDDSRTLELLATQMGVEFAGAPPIVAGPMDQAELVKRLSDSGAEIDLGEVVAQPVLSVSGRIIEVNGEPVQVYEYDSVNAARAEAGLVSDDGMQYGTTALEWDVAPYFFHHGKLIVLYTGENDQTVQRLVEVLGVEFAGGG